MKKYIFTTTLFLLFSVILTAQSSQVVVPDGLLEDADAVIHYDDCSIDVLSFEKIQVNHKVSITILNDNMDQLSSLSLFYDKFTRVKSVEMTYFDASGEILKKVKKKDFDDYAASGNSHLYVDSRVIHYSYHPIAYPFTVEYEYTVVSKNTAFIKPWRPVPRHNVSLINSTYTVTYPSELEMNVLEVNFDTYSINKEKANGTIRYTISNVQAIKNEPLSPALSEIVPFVRLATNHFSLAGVEGKASNWEELGKWMYKELLVSQNNLSNETKEHIKKLVSGISDPIERAKIIYDFVQEKTRYMSIQIGIGGWKPMPTDAVDKLGYGDCKALTYYTKSLLDVAEVPSYYTVVYAGNSKKDIEKNLVAVQGNHAFLCLPTENDTVWLECTSQKIPFGYVNSFTDDRDVFIVKENGSEIRHTGVLKPDDNLQLIKATYSMADDGDIEGNVMITSYGNQYSSHMYRLDGFIGEQLKLKLLKLYPMNNSELNNIKVKNNKPEKRFEEAFSFTCKSYGKKYAENTFGVNINPLNKITYVPERVINRKTPFKISRGYMDRCEYVLSIPKSYKVEELPKDVTFSNEFGTYNRFYKLEGDQLKYTRSFTLKEGTHTKEEYNAYRKFRKKITKLEKNKILLKIMD